MVTLLCSPRALLSIFVFSFESAGAGLGSARRVGDHTEAWLWPALAVRWGSQRWVLVSLVPWLQIAILVSFIHCSVLKQF